MTFSLVLSTDAPKTVALYDERWERYADHEGVLEDFDGDKDKALEAIRGSRIVVREIVESGDQEIIDEHTYENYLEPSKEKPGTNEVKTKLHLAASSILRTAIMTVETRGYLFRDPDTGQQVSFDGTLEQNMDQARRLGREVCVFVDAEIGKRNPNPLEETEPVDEKKKGSGRRSTKS